MQIWCNNRLIISHRDPGVMAALRNRIDVWDGNEKTQVRAFLEAVAPMSPYLSDFVVLDPEKQAETDKSRLWTKFAGENWGAIKWKDFEIHNTSGDELDISFVTIDVFPTNLYRTLAKQGFSIEGYCLENSMMFGGERHIVDGAQVKDIFIKRVSENLSRVSDRLDEIMGVRERLKRQAKQPT